MTSVFKDSCGALNVDVIDSVKLTEQKDSLTAKQTTYEAVKDTKHKKFG